jgi:two-component system NtrC family sensor kinase
MSEEIKILCVDDEQNVLNALKRLFIDNDYSIFTAVSGQEGLNILEQEHAQIIISDYRMPGMNGVEFLKEVCNLRPDTVRIVLSGYADAAAIVSAINEGQIYKFVPKPWNDDELRVTVANAIERYFLYKKNKELGAELQKKMKRSQN